MQLLRDSSVRRHQDLGVKQEDHLFPLHVSYDWFSPAVLFVFFFFSFTFFASCVFSLRPCPTSRKFSLVLPSFQGSSFCPFLQTLPSLSLLFLPRILSLVLVSSQSFSSLLFYFFPCFFFLPFFLLQFFLYLSLLFSNLLVLTTFTRHVFLLPCYSLYYFLSSFSLSLPLSFSPLTTLFRFYPLIHKQRQYTGSDSTCIFDVKHKDDPMRQAKQKTHEGERIRNAKATRRNKESERTQSRKIEA